MSGRKPKPLTARIHEAVKITEAGCWEWQKARDEHGYGRMWTGSRTDGSRRLEPVHRVAYRELVGPIPEGLHMDHLCRNPPCCNPEHLEPVTVRENVIARGTGPASRQARQTECLRGHQFTPENTYTSRANKRYCRECMRIRQRLYVAGQRVGKAADR